MKNLAEVLKQWRWASKMGTRQAAKRLGVTNSTYSRLERGYPCDGKTLAALLTWLVQP